MDKRYSGGWHGCTSRHRKRSGDGARTIRNRRKCASGAGTFRASGHQRKKQTPTVDDNFHAKLVAVGLDEPRPEQVAAAPKPTKTLGALFADFNAWKRKAKPATRIVWRQVRQKLTKFFGEARDITEITVADAR
jgi:hypothetical protein